ncbi:hypothetical protein BDA96_01G549000 [Sorghum bicolor]|uniref:Uncharacterized protein n=1 Tax=Sorghum bicolor TaxID=4558 RepID=A0A921V247_SORBI|nr:hypothetical protein BDA96_01G549000 [Sorghum bicolor]
MGRWRLAMAMSRQIAALVEPCSTLSLEHGEPHEVAVVAGAFHASAPAPISGFGRIHIRQASIGFVRHEASCDARALLKLCSIWSNLVMGKLIHKGTRFQLG